MATKLEARLAALRKEYAAGLPASVGEARAAFDRIEAEGAEAIEACWQTVHRIYGTAGSYGLGEVARLALSLETLLGPHRRSDELPAEQVGEVRDTLEALATQASEAART